MNPKVVKLREKREKNVVKIASLQARNKKIDGMDICARDINDRKPLTQFAVLGAATCRWWR